MWAPSLPRVLVWIAAVGWGFYISLGTALAVDVADPLGRGVLPFFATWFALGLLLPSVLSAGWSIIETFIITACVILIAIAWLLVSGSLAEMRNWGATTVFVLLFFAIYSLAAASTLLFGVFAKGLVQWARNKFGAAKRG